MAWSCVVIATRRTAIFFPNEIADFGKRNLPFPVTAGLEGEGGHAGASHALFNFAAMFS